MNVALGLAVLVCFIAVGKVLIQEMLAMAGRRIKAQLAHDDHAFDLESLGITMADGGEPTNELNKPPQKRSMFLDDPPNILRSDN